MNIVQRVGNAIRSGLNNFFAELIKNYIIRELRLRSELRQEFADQIATLSKEVAHVRHDLHTLNNSKYGKAAVLKSHHS